MTQIPHPPPQPTPSDRLPLYGPEFAADPAGTYARLRQHGPMAPVELAPGVPATLVVGYSAALEVLRDPLTFPKDPRRWEESVPADCPVLPAMMYKPNCQYVDGEAHARLRKAVTRALGRVDVNALASQIEWSADTLIDKFAPAGEADLCADYARALPLMVLARVFGSPSGIGERLFSAVSRLLEGDEPGKAHEECIEVITELIALKRERPGADVTSWLLADPARLTDEELIQQLTLLMGAGTAPEQDLIANGLRLLLSDERFAGDLSGGSLPVQDALHEVLWTDPPMANWGMTYPTRDVNIAGARLPANQPILISFAAANTDPSIASTNRAGNRAHLAWGAGPHACPAKEHASVIASVAIERLLDRLPDMKLAVSADHLRWVPNPFHRALEALPVAFPPAPALPRVEEPAGTGVRDTPAPPSPSAGTAARSPKPAGPQKRRRGRSLTRWWRRR